MIAYDCHVHVTSDGKWFDTDIDASLDRLLGELENSSINRVFLLPVGRNEEELKNATKFIITLMNHHPEKLSGLSAYYSKLDINQVVENNLRGIKIHPRQNRIDVLNKKMFPLYEAAAARNLPILFDSYCTPISSIPLEKIRPLIYRHLADKFPSLKIILAHCGMPFIWEAYTVLKWYRNIFADLSHILQYFKGTSLINDLAWVVRKIPQKFLYGSDFPETKIINYFEEFKHFCKIYDIPFQQVLANIDKIMGNSTELKG